MDKEELEKAKIAHDILKRILSTKNDIYSKVMLSWDNLTESFQDLLQKYIVEEKNESKLELILNFFEQIEKLTNDLKKELEK